MGRSFESVRQGVEGPIERWARTARALRTEERPYGEKLVALAKLHSSEVFYDYDDPLEAAVFSGLIEILKQQEAWAMQVRKDSRVESGEGNKRDVDP